MRNILAITLALMIAAVLLMPAMGFTINSPGNQSYSIASGPRVNYSISMGIAAHNLTQEMIAGTARTIAPAVTTTRVPYSFNIVGRAAVPTPAVQTISKQAVEVIGQPASLETVGTTTVKPVAANITAPAVEVIGQPASLETVGTTTAPVVEAAANITAPVVEAAANITAPVAAAAANITAPLNLTEPVVTPPVMAAPGNLSITGSVFDDANGNAAMDSNETGLADWSVVLEKPDGIMANTTTAADGSYAFNDLSAGTYKISEVLKDGWTLISPKDNKISMSLAYSMSGQNFANQKSSAPAK